MKIAGFQRIVAFIEREKRERPQLAKSLDRRIAAWRREVQLASWSKPTDIQAMFGSADQVGNNRVVFNVCGNHYRLIVQFNYPAQQALICFIGTHEEYDRIDARTV